LQIYLQFSEREYLKTKFKGTKKYAKCQIHFCISAKNLLRLLTMTTLALAITLTLGTNVITEHSPKDEIFLWGQLV